jgi:Phage integrase, N-terminal SAM-like domain
MTEVPGLLTRIFPDTEFVDDGRVIEPVSLALVSETGAGYYAVFADGGADRAVRDQRPSVRVTRRSRRINPQPPLPPGDASRRPCLRHRRFTPPEDTWRRLQRGHQPPVDVAAVRIRRPRRELLDDPFPIEYACCRSFEMGESVAVWRVFWVSRDAVRAGVRRRVLAGWEDLPAREDTAGVRAGDPVFLSPDYRVDPPLSGYGQSARFRRYTAETRRNYATDIALLLTFLWGRGMAWTDAAERDLEDYEHWRRFAGGNPGRVSGTKWDRELAAFVSMYGWAVKDGCVTRNPVAVKQVRGRNGEVVTVPAARTKDARPSNVYWLTPRTWRRWTDVGLRGHGRDGVPEPGWAGRLEDRNVAFVRLLVSSGLRRSEGGSLLTFEFPNCGWTAAAITGGGWPRG